MKLTEPCVVLKKVCSLALLFFLVFIERTDSAVKKASEKFSVAEGEKGAISNRSAPAISEKQNSKLVESVNSRKRYVIENFASQMR